MRGRLAALTLAWVVALVALQALRFDAGFHYEWEDDALSHQMLWNVGRGAFLENSIHPLHRPSHLEAVLVLLWPLYAGLSALLGAWPAVWTLKAALLGATGPVAYGLARHEGAPEGRALRWALLALVLPATLALALSTFRPIALAVAPLVGLVWAVRARHLGWVLGLTALTLCFREDLALAIVPLAGLAAWRREWRLAAALSLLPALAYGVATRVVLPAVLPMSYESVVFGQNLGPGLWERIFDGSHLLAVAALLVPVLGLPLAAPEAVVGASSVAAVLLFKGGFAGNLLHFVAPATAACVAGAIIVGERLGRDALPNLCLAVCGLLHLVPGGLALVATDCAHNGPGSPALCRASSPFDPVFRTAPPLEETRKRLTARIPPDASVAAPGHLLPRLTPRQTLWEYGHADVPFGTAEWILLDDSDRYAGAGRYIALGKGTVAQHVAVLRATHDVDPASADGLVLLHRVRPGPDPSAALRALMPRRDAPPAEQRGVRSPGEDPRGAPRPPAAPRPPSR